MWFIIYKVTKTTPNRKPFVKNELTDVKPVAENNLNIFDVSNEGFSTGHNPFMPNVEFWDQLHKKYQKILKKSTRTKTDEL